MSQQLNLFPVLYTAYLGWGMSLQFTCKDAMAKGIAEFNKRPVFEIEDPHSCYDFAYVDSEGHTVARVTQGL